MEYLDFDRIVDFIGGALSHQITIDTIAFGVAAWIHSGRVKKEIASQFSQITLHMQSGIDSINMVATVLRNDLQLQSEMTGSLRADVTDLRGDVNEIKTRVNTLEEKRL